MKTIAGTLLLSLFSCQAMQNEGSTFAPFPYQLNKPNETYELPKELKEISGMGFSSLHELACIQDEKANIYFYNLTEKKITAKLDFGKNADYEGIAIVDSTAYVLRNDGNLYEVQQYKTTASNTVKHKSFLTDRFNTEGLCLEKKKNRLLIACKAKGKGDDFPKGQRSIFAFDLATKKYQAKPVYQITKKAIEDYLTTNKRQEDAALLTIYRKKEKLDMAFNPSDISIHPKTGKIYLLSAFTRLLAVIDPVNNSIKHLEFLAQSLYPQPEGITFTEQGDLLISSEGKVGLLYVFETRK